VGTSPLRWTDDLVKVVGVLWMRASQNTLALFGGGLYPEVDLISADMVMMMMMIKTEDTPYEATGPWYESR
jgi:hypothetical protein